MGLCRGVWGYNAHDGKENVLHKEPGFQELGLYWGNPPLSMEATTATQLKAKLEP